MRAFCGNMDQEKLLSGGKKEERMNFAAEFPIVVQDILASEEVSDMPETIRWTARVMHYNVPDGKLNR